MDALDEAQTEDEVVRLVRAYVDAWSEHDLQKLPVRARPENISDGRQVARWAYALAACRCSRSRSDDEPVLVETMAAFFAHATHRLALLASPHQLVARRHYQRLHPG